MDNLENIKQENKQREINLHSKVKKLIELEEEINSTKNICKICLEKEVNRLFLPCRHLAACEQCAILLKSCHICRSLITSVVNISYSSKNCVRHAPHITTLTLLKKK